MIDQIFGGDDDWNVYRWLILWSDEKLSLTFVVVATQFLQLSSLPKATSD